MTNTPSTTTDELILFNDMKAQLPLARLVKQFRILMAVTENQMIEGVRNREKEFKPKIAIDNLTDLTQLALKLLALEKEWRAITGDSDAAAKKALPPLSSTDWDILTQYLEKRKNTLKK